MILGQAERLESKQRPEEQPRGSRKPSILKEAGAELLQDVFPRWVIYLNHMLRAEQDFRAWPKRQPVSDPGIVTQHSQVRVASFSFHDDPHAVHASVDEATAIVGLDDEQKLRCIPTVQRLACLPTRECELSGVSRVALFTGFERPAIVLD